MGRWLVVLVLASGCGRIGFDGPGVAGGDANNGEDASGNDAAMPPDGALVCGAPADLTDDFNGAQRPVWNPLVDAGVTVSQASGALRITPPAGMAQTHYGAYRSVCMYDFREHTFIVEITSATANQAGVEMLVTINTLGARVGFNYVDGMLYAATFDAGGGAFTPVGQVAFSPVTHRLWRIRETGGTMFFDTSSGTVFTPLGSVAAPTDLGVAVLQLTAGTYMSAAAPGVAAYDNLVVN